MEVYSSTKEMVLLPPCTCSSICTLQDGQARIELVLVADLRGLRGPTREKTALQTTTLNGSMASTLLAGAFREGAKDSTLLSDDDPYTGYECDDSWPSYAAWRHGYQLSNTGFDCSVEQEVDKRPVGKLSYTSPEEQSFCPTFEGMNVTPNQSAATAAICPSTISRGIVKSRKFPGRADKQAREKRTKKKTGIRCEHCYRGKKVCHKEGSYGHHDGLSFCQKWQLVRDRCSTCRIENRVCSGEYPCGHCVLRSHCVYSDYLKYNWGRTKT